MDATYISSQELLEKSQILYEFVDLFSNYENTVRSYSEDGQFSMTEVHLLAAIDGRPGLTSTELAEQMRRSKSFISQTITKLESLGYILRVSEEKDAKKKRLFVTPQGKKLCVAHSSFDEKTLIKTYQYLLRDCTPEEIASFYKVMQVYNNIMKAAERKRRGLPRQQ